MLYTLVDDDDQESLEDVDSLHSSGESDTDMEAEGQFHRDTRKSLRTLIYNNFIAVRDEKLRPA